MLTTGMLMLGKMSVGVRTIASAPMIRIRMANTTKVYGRCNASLTIHIGFPVLQLPRITDGGHYAVCDLVIPRPPFVRLQDLQETARPMLCVASALCDRDLVQRLLRECEDSSLQSSQPSQECASELTWVLPPRSGA